MNFFSTRNKNEIISGSKAIIKGIADDGGLYVPSEFKNIEHVLNKDTGYENLCEEVIGAFFPELELSSEIKSAYSKFYKKEPASVVKVGDKYILELFHGPTSAFKDFALVMLPHLLKKSKSLENDNERTIILTATSGDTGKAALEGFASKFEDTGIDIFVLYPQNGVSNIQKRQMITQEGHNVKVIGIDGNFDDAQGSVKAIFSDIELRNNLKEKNMGFSSANSINIGRLVPQIAYYFEAYRQMFKTGDINLGDKLSFCVPTGNFGDILAGYYAHRMGLPVDKLICASNENNVLVDFFESGVYNKKRELKCTTSPSMDIVVSSNLERLLYHMSEDTCLVKKWMQNLEETGSYNIFEENINDIYDKTLGMFLSGSADKSQAYKTIKSVFGEYGYLMDTHTAVAYDVSQRFKLNSKTVVLSTASPFKFASSVCEALDIEYPDNEFETLEKLSEYSKVDIPKPLMNLDEKNILHKLVIDKNDIKLRIKDMLLTQKDINLEVRIPATTANIGPGFDSLGIALNLYSNIGFYAKGLSKQNREEDIVLEFENVDEEFANRENLVYTSFIKAINHINGKLPSYLKIDIKTEIPVCRGLGSSATCIAAGVKAAFELSEIAHTKDDILKISNIIEGHPDNVAPAIMGGFRASVQMDGKVHSVDLKIDRDIKFFAFVPDFKLSTEYSRSVLPKTVDFKDVVYNLSHLSVMIGAFANNNYDILNDVISDKVHQDFRANLIDEYSEILNICMKKGAKATFLSGAGPTIIAIYNINKRDDYQALVKELKNNWKVYELKLDKEGIVCNYK